MNYESSNARQTSIRRIALHPVSLGLALIVVVAIITAVANATPHPHSLPADPKTLIAMKVDGPNRNGPIAKAAIVQLDPATGKVLRNLTSVDQPDPYISLDPKSSNVFYSARVGTTSNIYRLDLNAPSTPPSLVIENGSGPRVSPDGTRMTFLRTGALPAEYSELHLYDFRTSRDGVVIAADGKPAGPGNWTLDGGGLSQFTPHNGDLGFSVFRLSKNDSLINTDGTARTYTPVGAKPAGEGSVIYQYNPYFLGDGTALVSSATGQGDTFSDNRIIRFDLSGTGGVRHTVAAIPAGEEWAVVGTTHNTGRIIVLHGYGNDEYPNNNPSLLSIENGKATELLTNVVAADWK